MVIVHIIGDWHTTCRARMRCICDVVPVLETGARKQRKVRQGSTGRRRGRNLRTLKLFLPITPRGRRRQAQRPRRQVRRSIPEDIVNLATIYALPKTHLHLLVQVSSRLRGPPRPSTAGSRGPTAACAPSPSSTPDIAPNQRAVLLKPTSTVPCGGAIAVGGCLGGRRGRSGPGSGGDAGGEGGRGRLDRLEDKFDLHRVLW
ncbi:hypothetical protein CALVIDRAFT_225699 [Calocera viscosa TUFC12733]|uniref:Uncharacterized protein n=1 Tax=Calocera viscosa (strain TUFC12733) TaxID=1330018 RepID=A0A167K110_CALVF|nr:hypothetical protein CALVIDRAFT_225699 [Calocera viscosa TUFC12733]